MVHFQDVVAGQPAHSTVRLDRTLAALSDAHRRDMLDRLRSGPLTVSAIAEPLGMSLPGALKHIRILEAAALTRSSKEGRTRWCELRLDGLDEAGVWIEQHRRLSTRVLDRFVAHMADDRVNG